MKNLLLTDGTRIPLDDISHHSCAICYPESMAQVAEWWDRLTPENTTPVVMVYTDLEGNDTPFITEPNMHFNKIELEHCSTGLLMRIIFASSVEEELQRLLAEKNELEQAYNIMVHGQEEVTI